MMKMKFFSYKKSQYTLMDLEPVLYLFLYEYIKFIVHF
jgi:hypothetical protein